MFLLLTSRSLFSLSGGGAPADLVTSGDLGRPAEEDACCCWAFLSSGDDWAGPGDGVLGGGGRRAAAAFPALTPMLDLVGGVSRVAWAEILRSDRSRVESNTPLKTKKF